MYFVFLIDTVHRYIQGSMTVRVFKWNCLIALLHTYFSFLYNGLIVTLLVHLGCLELLFIRWVSIMVLTKDEFSLFTLEVMHSVPLVQVLDWSKLVVWIWIYLLDCWGSDDVKGFCRFTQMARALCLLMKGRLVLESFMVSDCCLKLIL